ncbi:Peptidase S9/S15 [Macrophomina phaseolina MS6]|uniref:Peptidase S9/S15 n=1 Tax=Macrophomina phaseolina (strain MS6) TaxID=1126212 RepID=K2S149_MACPH|nr:Peptidase S9/S15 [Macrophomina phaseolina MS6]
MADHIEIAGLKVPLIDTVRPEDQTDMFPYVKQTRKTEVLPKGWQKASNKRPLSAPIVYDQHIPVTLRDGVKIYVDVLRPHETQEKVPALLAISPYGNGGNGFKIYENTPFRVGVAEEKTSGLEKFESVDPAEWIPRGYAIVNVDVRGSWDSEGNLYIEGSQPGIDGYDVCEFIAAQDWCNGSVSMQGNSWLATTQWTTAVQKPPSLKCIAPWEGFTDKYREVCCRGGIPNKPFVSFIFNKTIRGRQKREDVAAMLEKDHLMNPYWADKNIDTTKIEIPIYALASYSSAIHGFGTVKSFRNAASTKKWLRIHPTQEWYDLYTPEANNDLQKFFDRYLKNIDNDWEKTTPVRVSVLRYNQVSKQQPLRDLTHSYSRPYRTHSSTCPSRNTRPRKPPTRRFTFLHPTASPRRLPPRPAVHPTSPTI